METQYLVGEVAGGRLVRVVGRGTMQESPAFREVVRPHLDRGLVVLDASECEFMDSTFLGCLIGIQKAAEQSASGRFLIAADKEHRDRLFSLSSLDKYFHFVDACPAPTSDLAPAEIDRSDTATLGRHVAKAHEELAERGGKEAPAFRAVARRLSEELDRT